LPGNVFGSRVSIELAMRDLRLAETVRDQLAPEVRLRFRRRKGRDYVVFAISSRPLVDDLARFGVHARKSSILEWPPDLPNGMARPFLLGYFDGDGFTTWSRTNRWMYPRWGLLGTEGFLGSAMSLLTEDLGIRSRKVHSHQGTFRVHIGGRDAFTVDAWLHEGFGFGLTRKRISFTRDAPSPRVA